MHRWPVGRLDRKVRCRHAHAESEIVTVHYEFHDACRQVVIEAQDETREHGDGPLRRFGWESLTETFQRSRDPFSESNWSFGRHLVASLADRAVEVGVDVVGGYDTSEVASGGQALCVRDLGVEVLLGRRDGAREVPRDTTYPPFGQLTWSIPGRAKRGIAQQVQSDRRSGQIRRSRVRQLSSARFSFTGIT